ncbi:hypothetical protein A6V25_08540 [Nostoc sp. ATCC 53789]|nr:hypothetical protein A6V25_08540 [Nostoc sp. ATCC 53789]
MQQIFRQKHIIFTKYLLFLKKIIKKSLTYLYKFCNLINSIFALVVLSVKSKCDKQSKIAKK